MRAVAAYRHDRGLEKRAGDDMLLCSVGEEPEAID